MKNLIKTKGRLGRKARYSDTFKRSVALAYLNGEMSLSDVAEEYDLPGRSTVHDFCKWYRKNCDIALIAPPPMTEQEQQELAAQKSRAKELERLLAEARLKNQLLETMIDVAEEELNISIRKKSGANQSNDSQG